MHDYILQKYNATYDGLLTITRDGTIYTLTLGVPSYMFPTIIAGEFDTDEEFLTYVQTEFATRNYVRIYFYKVVRLPISKKEE